MSAGASGQFAHLSAICRNVVQAEGVVQFLEQQQTAVRTDFGTKEFQPHTAVKSKPNAAHFACTLWVIHYLPPSVG
jgi:hypothetical protein